LEVFELRWGHLQGLEEAKLLFCGLDQTVAFVLWTAPYKRIP